MSDVMTTDQILEAIDAAIAPPMDLAEAIEFCQEIIGQLDARVDAMREDEAAR